MNKARSIIVTYIATLPLFLAASEPLQQAQSAAATAPAPVPAPTVPFFTLKALGHNVWAAVAVPGGGAGSNSGFVIGDDGVTVIDSFQKADAAKQLLAEIHRITPLPVKYVVNTHYHVDHVSGNGVYAEAGATIVAHRNVRDWIHTENLKFYGAGITPAQKASVEGLTGPQVAYDGALDLYLGARRIDVRYFPGHTGGDSVVLIEDANVVFCGDLFWRHTLPNLIDASTADWIATLATLTKTHAGAAFVSGHGDVGTADDVDAFRGYLTDLRRLVAEGRAAGKSGDALVEALRTNLKEKYGDWSAFDHFVKRNIADTDAELAGTKRIPHRAAAR
jgi:cyclase